MSYSISEDIKEETTKGRKNLKKILGHSTQKDGMVPIPWPLDLQPWGG